MSPDQNPASENKDINKILASVDFALVAAIQIVFLTYAQRVIGQKNNVSNS